MRYTITFSFHGPLVIEHEHGPFFTIEEAFHQACKMAGWKKVSNECQVPPHDGPCAAHKAYYPPKEPESINKHCGCYDDECCDACKPFQTNSTGPR